MSGSTIGGVVGGVVGWFVGGPQGAYYGWMIGSAVGGYVDPQQIVGPRLQDIRGTTSAVGGSIPRAWGTAPVPCNILWQAEAVEHKNTESGKGGPEQVTFTYTRSYAVMFHLGEIAGVLQIKRNGKIVYDARDDEILESEYTRFGLTAAQALQRIAAQRGDNAKFIDRCTIYNGTQTQNPDPTIEAYLGANNVPAYRGRAYMVVTDDDVTQEAGAIPQFEVIVASCGSLNEVDGWSEHPFNWMTQSPGSGRLYVASDPDVWDTSYQPGGGVDYTYVNTYNDSVIVSNNADGVGIWGRYTDDYGQSFANMPNIGIASCAPPLVLPSGRIIVLAEHATAATIYYSDDPFDLSAWTSLSLGVGANFIAGDDTCVIVASGTERLVSTNRGISFGAPLSNGFNCTSIGHREGLFLFGAGSGVLPRWSDDQGATLNLCTGSIHSGQSVCIIPMSDGSWLSVGRKNAVSTTDNIFRSDNGKTGWSSTTTPSMYFEGSEAQRLAERAGTVIASGKDASGRLQIAKSTDYGATWSAVAHGLSGFTVEAGIGVAVFPSLPDRAISIPDAQYFYTLPDGTIIYPSYSTLSPCSSTTIGEVIAELCELSGLDESQYDVSDLVGSDADPLIGYVVARETDAASVIESLRPVGMFDPSEWDGKVRFVKRGGVASGSINDDDLVQRDGDAIEREVVQEAELLRRVSTGYIDPSAGYSPNTQKWERRAGTIDARGEATFEVSAVIDADHAATVSKRKVFTAWGEPEKQKYGLPYRLSKYTPTDVLNYTDSDSEVHTFRIMKADDDSGVRLIESQTNCAEAYDAIASGVAPNPPSISDPDMFGPTILVPMNLDSLRAQDNVAGMYFAACGILAGWPGCVVEMSTDGGVSFRSIVTITAAATMGYLADFNTIDSSGGEPVKVTLYPGGELSSASLTSSGISSGTNLAAIMTADVGEIIQFQTATATSTLSYDLTNVERGINDTVPADHFYGDPFVILDADVIFVPIDVSFAGQTIIFRAVTSGTSPDAADEVSVVYEPPTFVLDGGGA